MGSISTATVPLERAAWLSPRIVVAKVLGQGNVQGLAFHRVEVLRTLKGASCPAGTELQVFDQAAWHRHTHAALLNVMSWAEYHYVGGFPADEIRDGLDLVLFLSEDSVPEGFPPGSVPLRFVGGHDRAEREKDVVQALQDGPYSDFNHLIILKIGERIRLPGGLEIRLAGHSHKRPMTDGPRSEGSELSFTLDGKTELIQINHTVQPDGQQSWATQPWGDCSIELRGMVYDQESTFVVWKRG